MDASKVADIVVGGTDSTGRQSDGYARWAAICRLPKPQSGHGAIRRRSGGGRRAALALSSIFALQGQINGLIDGWREHRREHLRAKAAMFDRRVADALKLALIGGAAQAGESMTEIKDDVLEERTSPARVDYAVVAAMAAVAAVLFACLMTSPPFRLWYDYSTESDLLWLGLGAGALGALFSVCSRSARGICGRICSHGESTDAIALSSSAPSPARPSPRCCAKWSPGLVGHDSLQ